MSVVQGVCRLWPVVALASACAARSPAPVVRAEPAPPAAPSARAPRPAEPALHHELKVALDPAGQRIEVEDVVTLSPELRARLGAAVVFSLHAGLSPERVDEGAPLAPAARGPASRGDEDDDPDDRVPLESFLVPLGPEERRFTVRYGGRIFHPVEDRGEEYARKMGTSAGLVSEDGAVLSGSTAWVPRLSDDLFTFAVEARVPAGWDAVSQGARTRHDRGEGGTLVRWESPQPQDEAFLVAARFVERARTGGRVALHAFLRSDDAALAETYLATGERYLAMYERLLGPYPYAKFAVVENFWETGYGMPSFTLLGPRILRFPFILHSSYPHEILHNWWGNGVFVDPEHGNWCEGLTAYLADHLVQEQLGRGAEYRRMSLQRYADYVAEHRDFAVREFRARHGSVTQAVGYDKVLMVFHMLRRKLGDERFVRALRHFYEESRFRAASFPDLVREMGAGAEEDLAPFFAQWVDRPGAPAVRLETVEATPRGGGAWALDLTIGQAQDGPTYAIDLPIHVTLASGELVRRSVHLFERRQRFIFALDGVPARVDVDPEYDLFRRLDPAELPPALSGAFGAARRVIVLPSQAPAELRAAYAELAEAWKGEGTEVVTDEALSRIPRGKAVWLLGWENRLREVVARALEPYGGVLTDAELRVGSTVLPRASRAAVVTVRSPADAGQVVAFLGADAPAALPGLARKLPHYGKYSLLGFAGEEPANVEKDTWPVLASPMSAAIGNPARLPPRAPLPARRPLADPPPQAR